MLTFQSALTHVGPFQAPMRTRERWVASLPPALSAPRYALDCGDTGIVRYYADSHGQGRPLLLIHGIHAVASAREMAPLFDAFRKTRPVYAIDLPGFGASERSDREYSPALYERAITQLLQHIHVAGGADVVALSLSAEFAARVALEHPQLVHSLVLISPTGFRLRGEMSSFERAARNGAGRKRSSLWRAQFGRTLFQLLTSRPSLRYYLGKTFVGRIDPRLLSYARATAAQLGAYRAPLAFVQGELFPVGDSLGVYSRVNKPALVIYGEDPYTSFGSLHDFLRWNPSYKAEHIARTGSLPHFEATARVVDAMNAHFDELALEPARDGTDEAARDGDYDVSPVSVRHNPEATAHAAK